MKRSPAPSSRLAAPVAVLAIYAAALAASGSARAQHCAAAEADTGARGVELSARLEAARFRTARYEGDYEGLFLRGGWSNSAWAFRASIPYYAIVRNGLENSGFGDVAVEARATLTRSEDERAVAGALLVASAPTGSADHDLGMGHFMLSPTLWASVHGERFGVETRLGYARAVGGEAAGHRHTAGTAPIVEPMSRSELEVGVTGVARAHRHLHARLAVYGAGPLPPGEGAGRAAAMFAHDLLFESTRLSLELHLPLVGDAFRGKVGAEVGFRF